MTFNLIFLSLAGYRRSDACQLGRFRPTSSRKMAWQRCLEHLSLWRSVILQAIPDITWFT